METEWQIVSWYRPIEDAVKGNDSIVCLFSLNNCRLFHYFLSFVCCTGRLVRTALFSAILSDRTSLHHFHVRLSLTFPCHVSCADPSEYAVSQFCVCKLGLMWQNPRWNPEYFLQYGIDLISRFIAFTNLIMRYFLPLFWLGLVSDYLLYHYLVYLYDLSYNIFSTIQVF